MFVNFGPISTFLPILDWGDQAEFIDTHIRHIWRPQIFDLQYCEASTLRPSRWEPRGPGGWNFTFLGLLYSYAVGINFWRFSKHFCLKGDTLMSIRFWNFGRFSIFSKTLKNCRTLYVRYIKTGLKETKTSKFADQLLKIRVPDTRNQLPEKYPNFNTRPDTRNYYHPITRLPENLPLVLL